MTYSDVHLFCPSLDATLIGVSNGTVEKYQNIKYGQLKARFTLAESFTYPPGATVNCTHQGPLCPQATPYKDSLVGVPDNLVKSFELNYDEFECLNLMITKPTTDSSDKKLPVMVWIHGGGNIAGTPYRHLCDPSRLVQHSIDIGKPVIVVSIQYRVHVFGWLPFDGVGNFGLHDQKLALQWVHDHIGDFVGDFSQVTLIGQSAGSCCAIRHAQNPTESGVLFQQAAFLSGSMRSMAPVSLKRYQELAARLAQECNVHAHSLVNVPWQDLVEATRKLGIQILYPVDDGIFLPKGGYTDYNPKFDHSLRAVLISDCIEDGFFFIDELKYLSNEDLEKLLVDAGGSKCLKEYGGIQHLNDIMTDLCFCKGNEELDVAMRTNQFSNTKIFRQFFDAMNPLSPHFGNNHMVEVFYYFGAYLNDYTVNSDILNLSRQCQHRLICFLYGESPWPEEKILQVTDTLREVEYAQRDRFRRLEKFPLLEFGDINDSNYTNAIHVLVSDGWANINDFNDK
jgi:carboxylesterase type B